MVAEPPKAVEHGALSAGRRVPTRLVGLPVLEERELCFSCFSRCAEHGGEAVALFWWCEG
jgi:hypothetical protein